MNEFPSFSTDTSPALASSPTKPRSNFLWLIGASLGAGVVCVGMVICVVAIAVFFSGFASEQKQVAEVVDQLMLAMTRRDVGGAMALFLEHPQKAKIRASLEDLLTGANFVIFDGYQTIEVLDCTIGLQSASSPDEPQGLVANVNGAVTYADGYMGDFEAVLVKENGEWKMYAINVNVSPDKLEAYLKDNP